MMGQYWRKSANFPQNSALHSPVLHTENFRDFSLKMRLSPGCLSWWIYPKFARFAQIFGSFLRKSSLDSLP
jgi:hypothetical protein